MVVILGQLEICIQKTKVQVFDVDVRFCGLH